MKIKFCALIAIELLLANTCFASSREELAFEQDPCHRDNFNDHLFFSGGAPSDSEAVRIYKQTARQNHAEALFNLGVAYYLGQGVAGSDSHQATTCWLKAAEFGSIKAQYNLGFPGVNGLNLERHDDMVRHQWQGGEHLGGRLTLNLVEPQKWLRKAAERGDAKAQFELGSLYSGQTGSKDGTVRLNYVEAYMWMLLSAANDAKKDPRVKDVIENTRPDKVMWWLAASNGQSDKSRLYLTEEPRTPDETQMWLRRDAFMDRYMLDIIGKNLSEHQMAEARRRVAQIFPDLRDFLPKPFIPAEHIPKDDPYLAALRKKAEQGDAQAQISLAQTYAEHCGDYETAYMWAALAAVQGSNDARRIIVNIEHKGEGVDILSLEQRVRAKKKAAALFPNFSAALARPIPPPQVQ